MATNDKASEVWLVSTSVYKYFSAVTFVSALHDLMTSASQNHLTFESASQITAVTGQETRSDCCAMDKNRRPPRGTAVYQ